MISARIGRYLNAIYVRQSEGISELAYGIVDIVLAV